MQTMEMGPAEAAMTQIPALPPTSSSSYYLQLDPSGHVDILESSLALSKPDMAEETVYEIQLDHHPFMMDERNVEVINIQNLPNTVTFQPEFLEEHQFTFDNQVHYQMDDLNQMLLNAAAAAAAAGVPTSVPMTMTEFKTETYEDETVPDFTVETEVTCETEACNPLNSANSMILPCVADHLVQNIPPLEYTPMVQDPMNSIDNQTVISNFTNAYGGASVPEEAKTASDAVDETKQTSNGVNGEPNNEQDPEKSEDTTSDITSKTKVSKLELPDKIMDFTEEPVTPPLVEITPTSGKDEEKVPPQVITLTEDDNDESSDTESPSPYVSKFLYEGIDVDDELYISYLSRPDSSKTAMCILCYEWFDDQPQLTAHLKEVHENNMKLYGCKRCGKQFWSRFHRQRHEKLHRFDLKGPIERYFPKNRPFDHFESKHFFKRFRPAPFTEKYRDHLRLIHSQIKSAEFDCIQCDEVFQNEEELREHYEELHALQTCVHCGKQIGNAKELREHEKEVHSAYSIKKNYPGGAWKLWESWDCEEMMEKDERLVNVFLYHNYTKRTQSEQNTGEEVSLYNCDKFTDFCEEVTVSEMPEAVPTFEKKMPQEKPKRHKHSHKASSTTNPGETPKARKSDPKPTSSTKLLDFDKIEFFEEPKSEPHVKRKDLPFRCEACDTSFDNEPDLQRHVKSHTIRTMAYMCQYCGRGFATHSNRKEHERIHTGDKPYVCPICGRAFVQISNLKKHIQTHKDKNNLQCSTCNKQFVKESSLILHQRAHSQDRKFRCHICDRAYNYASLLKRHMRIHTGENPYSCEDCGMQFHELVSLHYHRKKVHTGERPHRCDQCGRAFILSSDLKKHLKIHLRDGNNGNSIKSSGASAKHKSSSKFSASATTNGTSDDSLTPPMDIDELASMDMEYSNSSLMENQPEEFLLQQQDNSEGNRLLIITEKDLLNVAGTETNVGAMHQDPTNTINHENNVIQLATEALP